ncbi:MAG: hypothetical protein ACE5F7_02655 [Nitrospiria bacterium]
MKKAYITGFAIMTVFALFASCAYKKETTNIVEQTLGQELIDLIKAKEAGAISNQEYEDLKVKLKGRLTR